MATRPVWAEVDLEAIGHNLKEIRRITNPKSQIMPVVKANGYGHGAIVVSKKLLEWGADRLAVGIVAEGRELREADIEAPIVLLGYTPIEHAEAVIEYNLIPTVYTLELAEALSRAAVKANKTIKIHIKLDTGMGRIGFTPGSNSIETIVKIANLPKVEIEGVFSHFATADCKEKTFTERQFEQFLWLVKEIESKGIKIPIKHIANSGAIIDSPHTHLDMVRPGIIVYGYYPSDEVNKTRINLRPSMTLKASISYVKEVAKGTSISYGRTHVTKDVTKIASLPIGYADGYSRILSSKGEVLIKGQRVPVVGRICMNQCMVDIARIHGVKIGDEAVIFGKQGEAKITVEEVAEKLGTINYEVVCMVSDSIPRIYKS